ncbi:MAG: aspartate--tRNA ligase [Bacillota bacterium]|nr:aspartate--tRNA ligase [Bacillota bacterium]
MGEQLGSLRRTHRCGVLRSSDIGNEVVLMGWVQKRRNLGSLIFVDLRDSSGITQVVFDGDFDAAAFDAAQVLRGEFVIAVTGEVRERFSKNPNMPTGDIEVFVKNLKVLSESEVPPIHIDDEDNAGERLKLEYRYLDLRKPRMQSILQLRHNVSRALSQYLDQKGFISVETPILNKPTPEGARDYLVPSRVHPGRFYSLPQSPQLLKQTLMVSGVDRYYQIAKCFRDEDLRADRQPEFTQVDIEMSFVDEEDVRALVEEMYQHIFRETVGYELQIPFPVMTFDEAMERYGSDKPDLRFGFELRNLSEVLADTTFAPFRAVLDAKGSVRAINLADYGDRFSRKEISKLEELAKNYGAKGLAYIKTSAEGVNSSLSKVLTEAEMQSILRTMDAGDNDLILIVADKHKVVFNALSALRGDAARKLDLVDENSYNVLWVIDMPLFEYDEEAGRYFAAHHPFTSPKDEFIDRIESDPDLCRAKAYDLVINGYEAAGGSIRIHRSDLQARMFKALGFSDEEMNDKFGFLLRAFRYGTPPHGGIAAGLDRLIMLLAKTDNIKDVIAFPKTQDAKCLMMGAPGETNEAALDELHIATKAE